MKEFIKEQIRHIVNETARLMTEKWSISDQVENTMEYVYSIIAKDLGKVTPVTITKKIFAYVNDIEIELFGEKIFLHYVCYNCTDDENCMLIYNNGVKYNNFSENDRQLTLTLYLVNGEIIENYSNGNIMHELEHIYQIINGRNNNPNFNKLMNSSYDYASKVISNENEYSQEDSIIAWLIYYSNSHEQDAFINEYYDELKRNFFYIHTMDSGAHKILKRYCKYIEYFKNNLANKHLISALNNYRIFGYTKKNFLIMLDKQYKRFVKKMKNVEKHFKGQGAKLK